MGGYKGAEGAEGESCTLSLFFEGEFTLLVVVFIFSSTSIFTTLPGVLVVIMLCGLVPGKR